MKKVFLAMIQVLIVATYAFAADSQTVSPALQRVKLFPQGAELQHSAMVELKKGTYDLVIEGIADCLDPMSVRAGLTGEGVTVMSVGNITNHMEEREDPREIRRIKDSLERLAEMLDESAVDRQALTAELELILAAKNPAPKSNTTTAAESLRELADFYAERIPEINKELLRIKRYEATIHKTVDKFHRQIGDYNAENKPVNQLRMTIRCDRATKANLILTYFAPEAWWTPFYDLRAGSKNEPVRIDAKAFVSQKTGLEWDKVELTLTNRNINSAGRMQKAQQFFVQFMNANYGISLNGFGKGKPVMAMSNTAQAPQADQMEFSKVVDARSTEAAEPAPAEMFSQSFTSDLFVEFVAKDDYTIPSDGKEIVVALGNYSIEASYEHYTAPKLSLEAFIVAKLRNFAQYHLIPGSANVFFENTFIGKTNINPQITDSVLQVSLGADPGVVVTREIRKDFTEEKFLSSNIERRFCFVNTIKNAKSESIDITIEDIIPTSKDERITVNPIETDWGKLNTTTGIITKKTKMQAGDKLDLQTIYSVKYPANEHIINPY